MHYYCMLLLCSRFSFCPKYLLVAIIAVALSYDDSTINIVVVIIIIISLRSLIGILVTFSVLTCGLKTHIAVRVVLALYSSCL